MKKFSLLAALSLAVALSLFLNPAAGAVLALAGSMRIDGPQFENVVATGKATARFTGQIGQTIEAIILQLGGTALTKAMLSNIRLLANDKVFFENSGSRIDDQNEYSGLTANAAFLTLDFRNIRAHLDSNKYAGCIDTVSSGIRSLSAEVDIAGATAPTLACQVIVRDGPLSDADGYNRLIAKQMNKTWNPGAAGEFSMPLSFQRHDLSLLKRVHLHGATVTAARVKVTEILPNGGQVTREIFKGTDAQNDFSQIEYQRVPQANVFTIDFCEDGDVRRALRLRNLRAIEWLVTVSGAGNVVACSELLDPLENN